MDEGDSGDVAAVGLAEDVRSQGKESECLVENRNGLESQDRVILREGDFPRSSVQQFVDILDGKDLGSSVNIVDTSQNPCASCDGSGEGRVQELTLGNCDAGFSTMNEGEMMDTMLTEWQHGNKPGDGSEAETSLEHSTHKGKYPTTSSAQEGFRYSDGLAAQRSDHNANLSPGKSTYYESDAVLQRALSSGAMRMKIISKSSGCPEYFIKNTLKGKGVLCKGPISAAKFRGHSIMKAGAAPTTTSNLPVTLREKPVISSDSGPAASAPCVSSEHVIVGITLRDWMKAGQHKLNKVDSLCIFKQILDLVHSLHLDGKVLVDLRPSCLRLLPSRMIKYCGRLSAPTEIHGSVMHKDVQRSDSLKRSLEQGDPKTSSRLQVPSSAQQHAFSVVNQLEEKWYRSPEELFGRGCTSSSNIYSLGIFLFELLSSFDSEKVHAAAMSDLRHRILPPNFLSENPKEAGFCLWLLHPEPSLRPTARDILQSEVMSGFQTLWVDDKSSSIQQDEGDSELLLHFLMSVKEQKQKHASRLVEDLGSIESDIKELEKRCLFKKSTSLTCSQEDFMYVGERGFLCSGEGLSSPVPNEGDSRFLKNVAQLESAYFSARSQIRVSVNDSVVRSDGDILKSRENWYLDQKNEEERGPFDDRGAFFDGLCKYARYSKLEVCGTIRNRDITNSTNVVCSLSFDRDEDYFAAAGVSKKIKIFEFQALYDSSVDIHYPMIEMSNKSKLSCVCWNNYIRNYLASTDYDGVVKLWDASTGQEFSQYTEHEKRAWSVDFSLLDPTKLASGSDDCSVKVWSINERNCLNTIRTIANVCCVQFSAHSSHLLAFGSSDYKIYCYDLRKDNVPWCVLAGHEKAVSYVKFVDSGTLVSASTDNTLKLWDLSRSSSVGFSNNACSLTLSGHTNEKNFVGLSVAEGYIACGSETNEVYTYYKSLPMPITSHKFGSIDPISGKETDDDNGQFVSSVCWKGKSNVVVAANSNGCIKVLKMV